ncbi:MAG: sigma-70 family RNA polymerase sigma factor [Acidobacteria bacterium]|nr:sigma-70 family RNA polymerase sigma factor [Acidobacteriota bacterium]
MDEPGESGLSPEEPGKVVAELERLHARSFAWALACCRGNRSEAEEVLQVVYMKVVDGSARFSARSRFRTWLFGVIRLTALERRRTALLHRLLEFRTYAWHRSDGYSAAPKTGDEDERAEALRSALGKLPRRQREVINLVFYQDMSVAEAAEVMQVSVGSARSHYERGKKRLRIELQAVGMSRVC